ncbi:protein crumbs-like protein 3 isoform a precursor [Daubentonia madagascariensis]|uniref:Protein crumbs-like protein 3 isoform a n=1 Tax=Daubentonia madagascariensis TaxID=31869 RepID=A0ABD2DCB6_DAUMA
MANPSLGLLLALGLPLLPAHWGRAWGQTPTTSANGNTTMPAGSSSNGALSQEAITAIIVVFSILAALLLAVGLALLVRKLREKRQTEGTYRPSSEEQVGARVPPPPNLKLPPEERLI